MSAQADAQLGAADDRESRPRAGRMRRGEARRKLIEAALELFSSRPYDEVTVSEFAQAAGVAHGLLFHYFSNKRGLYLASLEEAAIRLTVAHEVDPAAPPGTQVREVLTKHLGHLAGQRHVALNLILRGVGNDVEAWQAFESARWEMIRWLCKLLELDPDHDAIRLVWRAFAGAADEATVYWLSHEVSVEVPDLVEGLVEILVGALNAAHRLDATLPTAHAVAELRRTHSED